MGASAVELGKSDKWAPDVPSFSDDPVSSGPPGTAPPGLVPEVLTAKQRLVRFACVFFNVLCGLTNGYDICVTSAVLERIVDDFALCGGASGDDGALEVTSCPQKQAVFSLSAIGSLCSKLLLAWFADQHGRRLALAFVDCMIVLAVLLQCLAGSAQLLLLGRFLLGAGLGLAFVVEPTYVCEIAPADRRGRFVVLNEVAVCVGCIAGLQVSSTLLQGKDPRAWRVAVGLGAVPACVQLLFLWVMPESPRWLAVQGRKKELLQAARRLAVPGRELHGLLALATEGREPSEDRAACVWRRLWDVHVRAWGLYRASFLLALGFSFFSTASGIYAMQGYARDILSYCGVEQPLGLLPMVGWVKLCGSCVAVVGADMPCAGRRRLALLGGAGCMLSHLVLAWRIGSPGHVPVFLAGVAFFLFVFAWNSGYGSLQFVATLELLPSDVRSLWAGQIFAVIGLAEVLIYQLFETLLLSDGVSTFLAFAGINGVSALFAGFVMSDLRGRSLEEAACSVAGSGEEQPQTGIGAVSAGPVGVRGFARRPSRYGVLVEEPADSPSGMRNAPTPPGSMADARAERPQPTVLGAAEPDGI